MYCTFLILHYELPPNVRSAPAVLLHDAFPATESVAAKKIQAVVKATAAGLVSRHGFNPKQQICSQALETWP